MFEPPFIFMVLFLQSVVNIHGGLSSKNSWCPAEFSIINIISIWLPVILYTEFLFNNLLSISRSYFYMDYLEHLRVSGVNWAAEM